MPDKSNFNRRLHLLTDLIADIFFQLSLIFKPLNTSGSYIIDSFPIAICKNIRVKRSKLLKGKEYHGYNAPKEEYFYGVKVHMIVTSDGTPVEFLVTPGRVHDNAGLQAMNADLPVSSDLYGDAGYLNQEQKEWLACEGIRLKATTKKNSLIGNTWLEELEIGYYRKRVENTFADITAKFPKKIQVVTSEGLLLKILLYVIMISLISGNENVLAFFATNRIFTPDFAFEEIQNHQQTILGKTRLSADELKDFSVRLLQQVIVIPNLLVTTQSYYRAFGLCRTVDPDDTPYVALSIEFDYPLLTRDKPLTTGLRANGFTNVVLLDELIGWL